MKMCVLLLPFEKVARASTDAGQRQHERSEIEGKAPVALPLEGATRAPLIARSEIEGKAPRASLMEGATRAPLIARQILFLLFDN